MKKLSYEIEDIIVKILNTDLIYLHEKANYDDIQLLIKEFLLLLSNDKP